MVVDIKAHLLFLFSELLLMLDCNSIRAELLLNCEAKLWHAPLWIGALGTDCDSQFS